MSSTLKNKNDESKYVLLLINNEKYKLYQFGDKIMHLGTIVNI
jgi:hypothetical protein